MRWLRVFQEVAQEHREVTGATPSQQVQDAALTILSVFTVVVNVTVFLITFGGMR